MLCNPKCFFEYVKLLHDYAPSSKTVKANPPYYLDQAPCDYFLFPQMKNMLAGRWDPLFFQCLKGISENDYQNLF